MSSIMGDFVPSSRDLSDGTGISYTMGTKFNPLVPMRMTHFRWWVPATAQPGGAPIVFTLWDNWTSSPLLEQSFDTSGFEDQRIQVPLEDGPYWLTDETLGLSGYTVSVFIPNRYVATSGFVWSSAGTPDELICPQPGGFFIESSSPTYPTSNFNSGNYFADIVYDFGPTGPSLKVWNGTAEVDATLKVWNGTAEVDASVDSIV